VHEGGMSICPGPGKGSRWQFVMPDGTPHRPWWDAETLARMLVEQGTGRADAREVDAVRRVTSFDDPAAQTIRPRWAGEAFDLHACVEALFTMRLRQDQQVAA
jgi:hypothetical protein